MAWAVAVAIVHGGFYRRRRRDGSGQAVLTHWLTYYPTELRSTGIGAGLGVGRVGRDCRAADRRAIAGVALEHTRCFGRRLYLRSFQLL
ncbi:MAG: hypothetical protein U0Y68_08525 [Blastocatellia bacterium]